LLKAQIKFVGPVNPHTYGRDPWIWADFATSTRNWVGLVCFLFRFFLLTFAFAHILRPLMTIYHIPSPRFWSATVSVFVFISWLYFIGIYSPRHLHSLIYVYFLSILHFEHGMSTSHPTPLPYLPFNNYLLRLPQAHFVRCTCFTCISATDFSGSESVCFFRLFFVCGYSPSGLAMNKLVGSPLFRISIPILSFAVHVLTVKYDLHQTQYSIHITSCYTVI
jgi:hypothetical protein